MKRKFTDEELVLVNRTIGFVESLCDENPCCEECILRNQLCGSPDILAQLNTLYFNMKNRNTCLEKGES